MNSDYSDPKKCERCGSEFDLGPRYYGNMRDKICPGCFASVEETCKNRNEERMRLIESGEIDLDEEHEECSRCKGEGKIPDSDRAAEVLFSMIENGYGPNTAAHATNYVFKTCPDCNGRGYRIRKFLGDRGEQQLKSRGLGSDDCDFGKIMGWS